MNNELNLRSLLVGIGLVCAAVSANAGFTSYTTQAAFGAATSTSAIDTFNDLMAGSQAASMNRIAGSISYSVSAPSGLFGLTPTGGGISVDDRREAITFTNFSSSFNSIGATFFATNEAGAILANQSIWVTVTDVSLAQSLTLLTSNSAASFFGIASTLPVLSLSVSADPQNLLAVWPSVDNLTFAAAVPEPSTWLLFGLGAAAVAYSSRRRPGRFIK